MFSKSIKIRGVKVYVAEIGSADRMGLPPRLGVVLQRSPAGAWADILIGKRKFTVGWCKGMWAR